ncbi:conserved hypothetical protein [Ricinus communis]|uniref:Uncharacterized protein n=1 Tax=Ricinus communis TaxID=3988 RepID=B9T8W4_RICCO|nr:conserved hypothetical protein [Ricinus communis]
MSLRGDAIRQAGANKDVRPYRIRNGEGLSFEKRPGKERAMLLTDPFVVTSNQ